MATARCYTKSGSVEKYESNLWKSPTSGNWSSLGILGTITTPDSNGNYTVTPEKSFEDSSDTTTYSCFTEYGGVKKTFYFKKKEKEGIGYDLYCRVLYINDNTDVNDYNPSYSNFSDKFGINIVNSNIDEITYGKIYKDYKDGYFCGTFYSNKENTGSDTIEVTVKLESIIPGGQVNNGEVQFEFFLIPKDSNPNNYKNQPSIDGEISPTSEIIDNRIYNKGNQWGISKGNYAMDHPISDLDQNHYEQCSLTIGVRCNFNFSCKNLNRDDLNAWSLGDLSGIYTTVKNRYSTTIPYLKLNIIWDMNN